VPSLEEISRYWINATLIDPGLAFVAPNHFPEGFDVFGRIRDITEVDDLDGGSGLEVLEVGSGRGRLCRAFPASKYMGVDISPAAVKDAKERFPEYHFECVGISAELPKAEVALIYTIALHISDEGLYEFMEPVVAAAPKVAICEIMDSRWKHLGNPPAFNRDPEDYFRLMAQLGYALKRSFKVSYKRYESVPNRENRISFHLYERLITTSVLPTRSPIRRVPRTATAATAATEDSSDDLLPKEPEQVIEQ
jgi:SAM-dependent methyltransferase